MEAEKQETQTNETQHPQTEELTDLRVNDRQEEEVKGGPLIYAFVDNHGRTYYM